MINDHSPYVISGIERIYPGSFSSKELVPGFHYIEELVRRRVAGERPGRNDWCPCGSGKKFKKCHGV
jgi:hypothetical protein